jgi:hypothetical protein
MNYDPIDRHNLINEISEILFENSHLFNREDAWKIKERMNNWHSVEVLEELKWELEELILTRL